MHKNLSAHTETPQHYYMKIKMIKIKMKKYIPDLVPLQETHRLPYKHARAHTATETDSPSIYL